MKNIQELTYIDWLNKIGKLKRARQKREDHAIWELMYDEYGNFLLFSGMGVSQKIHRDMLAAKDENRETDRELQERFWNI